jgi:hypothetical protein
LSPEGPNIYPLFRFISSGDPTGQIGSAHFCDIKISILIRNFLWAPAIAVLFYLLFSMTTCCRRIRDGDNEGTTGSGSDCQAIALLLEMAIQRTTELDRGSAT